MKRSLALHSSHYKKLVIADFNGEANGSAISVFRDSYELKSLIKEPFFKCPIKTCCKDLILTNKPRSFQHSCVIIISLFYFHKMTATVMTATFEKLQLKVVNYRT